MDSLLASSSGCMGALPIETGQVLKPNTRYFAGYGCDSFLMPLRSSLKAGDTFEIWRTLEPKEITMTMPDGGLFYDGDNSFYDEFKWNAVMEGTPRRYLKITFNGLDFQSVEYTEQGSIIAAEGRAKSFTESGDFVVPRGVTELIVTVVAGGGGGGAGGLILYNDSSHGMAQSGSGGGGGGAVVGASITVSEGMVIPIVVGAGGSRGIGGTANANGSSTSLNGSKGGEGGVSSFGDFIECSGGKGGDFGAASLNQSSFSSGKAGGLAGTVIKNTTNGISYAGGNGGGSGDASGTGGSGLGTLGTKGESIGEYQGGLAGENTDDTDFDLIGTAGGGGASARGVGGDGENNGYSTGNIKEGGSYGGGGGAGAGNRAWRGTSGNQSGGYGGTGGNGVVYIEMVRA